MLGLLDSHQTKGLPRTGFRIFKFKKIVSFFIKLLWKSHWTVILNIFQQWIDSIKLETGINFSIRLWEQNILRTRNFHIQSRNFSLEILKSLSYEVFENSLMKILRPTPDISSNVSDSLGIKLFTRSPLGSSHLRACKFKQNFQGAVSLYFCCSSEAESTSHIFLRSHNFAVIYKYLRKELIFLYSETRLKIFHELVSIGRRWIWQ